MNLRERKSFYNESENRSTSKKNLLKINPNTKKLLKKQTNIVSDNTNNHTRKIKILFVYSTLLSFIRRDLDILEKHFDVKRMKIITLHILRRHSDSLIFFKLLKEILQADIVYSWFANWSAFFIVLFSMFLRKRSIIVVGGYDVVYIPEIKYGALGSLLGRFRTKFVLEHATKILPFSNYAKIRVLSITKRTNIHMIPLGCDTEKFQPSCKKKEKLVITVCHVKRSNIARKGLETFIKSAKYLPDVKFALIGRHMDNSIHYLKKIAPPNMKFTGYVPDEELIKWYQRAKVYCQLSYEEGEGAGGALGEAMACECIPVVSEKAIALKETVGSYGFYVPYGDVKATVKAIKSALQTSPELGTKVRRHIKELFSLEKREYELIKLVNIVLRLKSY